MKRGELQQAGRVLESGLEIFRLQKVYPDFMPVVYARLGYRRRAVGLAVEGVERHRDPATSHYQVFVGQMVEHGVEPSSSKLRRLLTKGVRKMAADPDYAIRSSNRMLIARYLVGHDMGAAAVPLLREEQKASQPSCLLWAIGRELSRAQRSELGLGQEPARCHSVKAE